MSAEDVAAYTYGLLGTGAFADQFGGLLGHERPRIGFPADRALFTDICERGRDLIWWHTYGERLTPSSGAAAISGAARCIKAVSPDAYPETHSYDPTTGTLTVGDGEFGPVRPDVWNFTVGTLQVVKSWLDYRMKDRSGKASSDLDKIRPEQWGLDLTTELTELLAVVERTLDLQPKCQALLERLRSGDALDLGALPEIPDAARKPPGRPRPPKQNDDAQLTLPGA